MEKGSAEDDMKLAVVSFPMGIPSDSGYVRQDCIVRQE
ncbi:hypothetical protein SynA1562_01409 [Synechococcus sp. A15-62]|nr:hypothetical protein SynA1562_01409 [Synechococcus sp. A15-62]